MNLTKELIAGQLAILSEDVQSLPDFPAKEKAYELLLQLQDVERQYKEYCDSLKSK